MTALAQDRNSQRMGGAALDTLPCPMAAAKVFKGGLVGINNSGFLQAAAPGSNLRLKIVGVAFDTVDNGTGNPGDKTAKVVRGTFKLVNGATTDALTSADIGRMVYALDDQTVVRTSALGARPAAGRLVSIDTDGGVFIDTTRTMDSDSDVEILMAAGADLSGSQFFIVTQNTSSQVVLGTAGVEVLGVLQNAPVNAAIAIVRVAGRTRCICGAAVTQGSPFASDGSGKAKIAARLVQATGAASYVLGRALTATATNLDPFEALITHSGVRGTSDA